MTSPTLLGDLPDLIATRIKAVMPDLATCKGLVGRADIETLKKHGVASPAVLISRVRTVQSKTYAGPHVTFTLELAAFVVCKDGLGAPRHEVASRIAQVLLALIPNSDWGRPDDLSPAEAVQELPMMSKAADEAGLSVAAVTWSQELALSSYPASEAIAPQVYLGIDPVTGTAYDGGYQQLGDQE